jgi:hypothetical protein
MRGFAYLTATVLVAIGIGVGVVAEVNGSGLGPVGTVSGRLVADGGLSAALQPLIGYVTLTNRGGASFTAATDSHGFWNLEVPPEAMSSLAPVRTCTCARAGVRVHTGGTVRLMVVCAVV